MKNNKLLFFVLGILFIGIISYILNAGIFNRLSKSTTQSSKIQVTASFYPLYFFASGIGGNKVDVKNITPAGAEPHDYEPTTQDIARIQDSKLLVLNGGVEAWGDKIKDNLQGNDIQIIVAGEGLLTKQLTEEGETIQDPHIWLDPMLAKQEVQKITKSLIAIDSSNTSYYQSNEKQLDVKLDQLDAAYKQGLSTCQRKDIITSHEAFGYLAARYGLNQVAIAGISPDEEPSSQQLADVAKFARDNNVKYIFFESLISPKLSETIATEVGAKTLVLNPLEGLSDEEIAEGKDYFTVMNDNLNNLRVALECK